MDSTRTYLRLQLLRFSLEVISRESQRASNNHTPINRRLLESGETDLGLFSASAMLIRAASERAVRTP